ncbi:MULTISPECIES: winged helix-turn-helix transcriptional regulator [Phyllobacteriaceae]|jgi:DNA-binding HxlR family transcriptional regulator|uniref:HxlR family transcriptional regulator n=1 Tax=Mesorhizobium hungaricum TaxID=1566387 RepID=A0A1C2E8W6_9HYPH|nr:MULTISPECIES: helix-turn-helix domain-containing protein [Mesorhizobium]MBN9236689.1 helix-turn-helix transcriptional regulator [Mesorhizobium sp.]MDQ0329148.1 DNA-binding HxlR family transcriptional regulator [Mesorhizobium sp. YL-MeA3-2017]OCX23426.1 HxlR family transcriptional regulator [Mesorhizobium hungaricum]
MDSTCEPYGYDAFRRTCPSHAVLEMLSSKWVYLTVSALRHGRMRNGELARKLEGITPKMLTQTLRVLERDGLVRRQVFPVIPPHVEYELTALGQDLAGLLDQIRSWSERHVPEIRNARLIAERGREVA